MEAVRRGAFAAKQLRVDMPHEHAHRGLSDVLEIVDSAPARADAVWERSRDTFTRLAQVEARMHGSSVDEVRLGLLDHARVRVAGAGDVGVPETEWIQEAALDLVLVGATARRLDGEAEEHPVGVRVLPLVARGEVVVVEGKFAFRITEIVSPAARIRSLG